MRCVMVLHSNLSADPNSVSLPISSQVTPVHVAASLGHLACLQLLVKSGGDIMALDKDHKTPLDHARTSRQDLCINYLHEELGEEGRVGGGWGWKRKVGGGGGGGGG